MAVVGFLFLLMFGAGPDAGAQVEVTDFGFLESREGPTRAPGPYRPGDTMHVSFSIVEFATDSVGRPRLSYDIVVLDPVGLRLNPTWEGVFNSDLPPGAPVLGSYNLGLSPAVPSGSCTLVLTVRDELNDEEHEFTASFQVDATPIPPATSLEIRDFSLSSSPEHQGVGVPELQGAGTVHVKFSVFGLGFRGEETDARIGMAVLGLSGETLFEEADHDRIRGPWVYRPPTFHVPYTGSVNIPAGLAKGTYALAYTVTDNLTGQTVRVEGQYLVR